MKPQKIPETNSIEELASFWDTHDLTDFEDELEEVTEQQALITALQEGGQDYAAGRVESHDDVKARWLGAGTSR